MIVLLHGEFVIMHFISIAFQDGSKRDKSVLSIIENGNFKNMANNIDTGDEILAQARISAFPCNSNLFHCLLLI